MRAVVKTCSRQRAWCAALTILVCWGLFAIAGAGLSPAWAQDTREELEEQYPDWPYAYSPVPKELRNRTAEMKLRLLVGAIFRNDSDPNRQLDGNESEFDRYFRDIIFRKWTHPSHLPLLVKDREFLQRTLEMSKNPRANTRFNEFAVNLLPKLADGRFHPAVRYNATLLLGSLNSKEPVKMGSNKSPAVPLIKVLPLLLDRVVDETQVDAVRVAALIGIRRHAEANLQAAAQDEIITRLLPILSDEPPPGRSPDAHAWVQRQVIDVLATLGVPGRGGTVTTALRKMLVDAERPLSLRCAAAVALAKLQYGGNPGFDAREVAGEIGEVGVAACIAELSWLKDRIEGRLDELESRDEAAGVRGGRRFEDPGEALLGPPGAGGAVVAGGDALLTRFDKLARRRLKTRLNAVRSALGGRDDDPPGMIRLAQAAPAGAEITTLAEHVDGVMTVLDDTNLAPEDLQGAIFDEATKLQDQVKKMQDAKKPAAGPAADTAVPESATGVDGPEPVEKPETPAPEEDLPF
jgi:hypothetical protein